MQHNQCTDFHTHVRPKKPATILPGIQNNLARRYHGEAFTIRLVGQLNICLILLAFCCMLGLLFFLFVPEKHIRVLCKQVCVPRG